MNIFDLFAVIVVPLVWGANLAVIKTAVMEFPPIFLIALRFFCVAMLLIWWFPIPRKQLPLIALLGCSFGAVHFGGLFFGLRGVDVSLVSILTMAGVPLSVVFARLLLKERFRRQQLVGMLIAFVGVLITFGEPSIGASPIHLIVVIVAVVAWGYGNIIIKWIGPINAMALNAWMGLFAAIPLFIISFLVESPRADMLFHISLRGWLCFLFLVFITTITAYGLWYYLVNKYDVSRIVPFTLLVPIAGVVAGVLLMDDILTWPKLLGGLITLIGIAIIQIRWRKLNTSEL